VWELFIPALGESDRYKVRNKNKTVTFTKIDPYGFQQEVRPKTAYSYCSSTTGTIKTGWSSAAALTQPISVYEVHLGSWLHASSDEPAQLSNGETVPPVLVSELKPGARFPIGNAEHPLC